MEYLKNYNTVLGFLKCHAWDRHSRDCENVTGTQSWSERGVNVLSPA